MSDLSDAYAQATEEKNDSLTQRENCAYAATFLSAIQRVYDRFFEYTVDPATGAITATAAKDAWNGAGVGLSADLRSDLEDLLNELYTNVYNINHPA